MTYEHTDGPLAGPEVDNAVLCLVSGPYLLVRGRRAGLSEGCQRLLVSLALHDGELRRRQVAGLLWPEVEEDRAAGNLRSVLWRLRKTVRGVVDSDKTTVWIRSSVAIDVASIRDWATRLSGGAQRSEDLSLRWWHPEVVDLLPGWDDAWIVVERERMRQHMLHALERLASLLAATGRHADGIQAALLAVGIEPLRESAQRRLVEAHLAEANVCEARRVLQAYRELVRRELGIQPSCELLALVPGMDRGR